jgi:CheY-like chemotaxis protein
VKVASCQACTLHGQAGADRAQMSQPQPCPSILVVEDESDIRESLKDALESEGYRVLVASNGLEALGMLPELRRPSLILLDLMMPVMDGWEFAEALQANAELATIPIVVVTAFGREAETRKIASRGAIAKPVDLDLLFDMVKRHYG